MNTTRVTLITVAWLAITTAAWAQERGQCEPAQDRASKSLDYIAESRKEGDSSITVSIPCTNEVVVIKKCAVSETRKRDSQRYCYPDGKPAYFELVDTLEFWERNESGTERRQ